MAKRDEIKFRGVLGGFRKSDVNNYIKETDLRHSSELEAVGEKLKKAEEELATEKAKNAELEKEKAELELRKSEYEDENNEFQNNIVELQDEVDSLAKEKEELNKRIASLEEELESAKSAKTPAEPVHYAPSTAEKVHARLGSFSGAERSSEEIISSARATAQKMISSAERECEAKRAECEAAVSKIRTETEEQAEYIRERLAKTAGAFLSNVSDGLSESVESCIREINACVNDMESEIKSLLQKISVRSEEMNGRIAYYREYLADGMGEKLSDIAESSGSDTK